MSSEIDCYQCNYPEFKENLELVYFSLIDGIHDDPLKVIKFHFCRDICAGVWLRHNPKWRFATKNEIEIYEDANSHED